MQQRFLTSLGAVVVVLAVLILASTPVAGQASSTSKNTTATKAWVPPRTSWGDPDIQGVFTNKNVNGVPFERPVELGDRNVLTDEELAARDTRTRRDENGPLRELADGETGGGPSHWADTGRAKLPNIASLIVQPENGRIPPLTPEGQRVADEQARLGRRGSFGNGPFNGPEDLTLYERCITRGVPGSMMPAVYGDSFEILQTPSAVAITYEMIHEARVIPLDGRPHIGQGIRTYMGDARGHFEGSTLVVETTNFKTPYRGSNPKTMRLIERFTRVGPKTVQWAVTVDDPKTWTRLWTFEVPLTLDEMQPVYEYACHEGNYGLVNILSGARTKDNEAAANVSSRR
ncbi:MAG: hypothetical protein C5B57_10955 [Blastocatellia bacterium]|nr:MAG: hypothetical protein C5B57_10955 [Blastocatellia bacterium]